jgi:hypothetical protein
VIHPPAAILGCRSPSTVSQMIIDLTTPPV